MSKRINSLLAVAGALILLFTTVTGTAQVAPVGSAGQIVDQIRGPISEADTVVLKGNLHPLARAEHDQGAVAPGFQVSRMALLLQPSPDRLSAAANLAAAQQNPASPYYHKWITPAQYAAQFGASPGDVAKIRGWLQSHGFSVEAAANQRLLYFSGTAAQVAATFHTQLHHYLVNGEQHIANAQNPRIPRALAPVVGGIVSLHDFRHQSMLGRRMLAGSPEFTDSSSGAISLFPADFGIIYDLATTWGTGYNGNTGAGVTIGIVGRSNIVLSDVTAFQTATHLPAHAPTIDLGGTSGGNTDPGLVAGDQDEATLDVEWAGAVAPGATIVLAPVPSQMHNGLLVADGVDLSAQYLVDQNKAQIISVSFGSCEQNMGATELAFYNTLWQKAALQGQTVVVSSGDGGAAGCDTHDASAGTQAAVNGLCSSPYSTCVGGTLFNDTAALTTYWSATNNSSGASAKSYIPEVVWNESAANGGAGLWASGGGISLVYPQPSWQSVATDTNGQRGVPDVSLTAAEHDGYVGYETVSGASSWYTFWGTSAAAPSYAGILALVSKANGATGQGNVNPVLYGLAASKTAGVFHATVSGDNGVPGVAGYAASNTSYNLATGLGSVDGKELISNWKSSTGLTTFALQAPSSATVASGATGQVTIAVTSLDNAEPTVAMKYSAPTDVTVSFSPASVQASTNSTTTATIVVGNSVPPGNYTVIFTGTAGSTVQTVEMPLTVTVAPTLSLQATTNSVQVLQASSVAVPLTVATNSAFTGNVSLSIGTLPTGVTATWSTQTVTPSNGAGTATLTLHAASSAAVQTVTFAVTASGDSLQATDMITLQVQQVPAVHITAAATKLNMTATGSASDTLVISTVGGLSGPTALTVSGVPAGVSYAFAPASLASPGNGISSISFTGSASVTATSFTATITATTTMSSTPYTATAAVAVTVAKSAPTITILANVANVTLVQGATVNNVVSFMTGGTFTGTVTLQPVATTGLPAGTTATWTAAAGSSSDSAVTVSGAGAATVTVINGLGTATLKLTAAPATANTTLSTTPVALTIKAAGTTSTGATATHSLSVTMAYSPQILVTPSAAALTMTSVQQGVSEAFTIHPVGGFVPATIQVTLPSNWPASLTESYTGAITGSTGVVTPNGSSAVTASVTVNGSMSAVASNTTLTFTFLATDARAATSTVSVAVPLTVTLAPPTLAVSSASTYSSSSPMTVMQGGTTTDAIKVTAGGAFATGTSASLAVTGLPAGITANWSTNANSSTSTTTTVTPAVTSGSPDQALSTLTLTAAATAAVPANAATITITATGTSAGKSVSGSMTIPLKLTYAPGLLVAPQTAAVSMSSAATSTEVVQVTAVGTPTVLSPTSTGLAVSGLPSGIAGSFGPLSSTTTGKATLTLTGSNTAVATTSPVAVTVTATATDANGATYTSTGTFNLTVTLSKPTLAVSSATPYSTASPLNVVQGGTAASAITVKAGGAFATGTSASLAVTGLPAGVTANWSTNAGSSTSNTTTVVPAITSGSPDDLAVSTLTLTAASSAAVPTNATSLTITATSGTGASAATGTMTVPLTLTYAPGMLVTVQTPAITMASANTATQTINVMPVGGINVDYNATMTQGGLVVTGLPNGVAGSVSGFGAMGTFTLTLTGSNTAVATTTPATITLTETSYDLNGAKYTNTATFTLALTLSAPTLMVASGSTYSSSSPLSVMQGSTAANTFTVTAGGSFATGGSATLSVAGLPAGVTASWSTNSIAGNSTTVTPSGTPSQASATLTLTAASSAKVSTAATNITITATGSTQTKATGSATVPVSVTAAPAIVVTLAKPTATMAAASTGTVMPQINVAGVGGASVLGAMNMQVISGLPAGMNWAINWSTTNSPANTAIWFMTLTGANTVAPGTYPVVISAQAPTGAPGTATLTLTVTKSAPTLTISPTSSAATLTVPASGTNTVTDMMTVTGGGSYSGPVTLSTSTLPAGITAAWDSNPATPVYSSATVTSTATPTLTLTASPSAAVGTNTITIKAVGDSLTATTTMTLVVGTASLTVWPSANSTSVAVPLSSTNTVTDVLNVATGGTYSGTVTLAASNLPSGITATWSPSNVITPSSSAGTSTLTLTAATSAAATSSPVPVTITATGDGLSSTTTVNLSVLPVPTLNISASAGSLSVTAPSSGTNTVTDAITLTGGGSYAGTVSLAVTGLPTGVTASWSSTPPITLSNLTASPTLTLTASTSAVATSSPATVTITATGDGLTASTTVNLTVLPVPELYIGNGGGTTIAVSGVPGVSNQATVPLTFTTNGTFVGVQVSITGMPSGVTATLNSSLINVYYNEGCSDPLVITVNSTAVASSKPYALTITATLGSYVKTQTFNLYLSAAPTLTAVPATTTPSVTASPTGSATVTDVITLTGGGTYSGTVAMFTSAMPAGVTASFNPSTVTLVNGTATTTLTMTVSNTAYMGLNPFVVYASGDGLTPSTTINLTVNHWPTMTISSALTGTKNMSYLADTESASSDAVFSLPDLITVTTGGTFSGNVALSVSGLPAGINSSWSASTVTPANNTATSTLTLSSGYDNSSAYGSWPITITATGGGITSTASFTLQVTNPTLTISASEWTDVHTISSGTDANMLFWFVCAGSTTSSTPLTLTYSTLPTGVTLDSGSKTSSTCASAGVGNFVFKLPLAINQATAKTGTYSISATVSTGTGYTATSTFSLVLK
jgi:subtilase family serine protease